jgi:choline dehydrogenase-like flavoprotein
MPPFDVLIVGSGPSGVQAAAAAVDLGARVALADVGETDGAHAVPEQPYAELRASDAEQHRYLLGDPDTALADLARAGAHLTPPRRYMVRGADDLFALASDTFRPLQATSAGGLGVSWGANVYTLTDAELQRVRLDPATLRPHYRRVSAAVGVSGPDDAFGRYIADLPDLQPPLPIDDNAQSLLRRYQTSAAAYDRAGFRMGQAALAVLSRDLGDRRANPLHDMDFYADTGRSVYRPQFTLESLKRRHNFTYLPGRLAVSFDEADGAVTLRCRGGEAITARRLILAAGAINTGRLVLQSLPHHGRRLPILCNPNHWVAAIDLAMLGRPAGDARYSLAQLAAVQRVDGEDVLAQFYSYRSLLTFRVLRGIPLPPRLGVLFMRLIATAFTCVNLHFADEPADTKYVELDGDAFRAHYALPPAQANAVRRGERAMLRRLVGLRCMPIGVTRPSPGASIHYAGTLPHGDGPLNTAPDGRLNGCRHVYVGDGSSWRWLPAKGLTFTLMANARRVAEGAVGGLTA